MHASNLILLLVLACVAAVCLAGAVDVIGARRGLRPPGFRNPQRRAIALAVLSMAILLVVFAPLATMIAERHSQADISAQRFEAEPLVTEELAVPHLFVVHGILAVTLVAWLLLGFVRVGESFEQVAPPEASVPRNDGGPMVDVRRFGRQLGLGSQNIIGELVLGVGIGFGAWLLALVTAAAAVVVLTQSGLVELLPETTPATIVWIAGLPVGWRVAVSISAGLVEELFFRGFLQPRIGIGGATVLFVLAHAGYGQVFMFVGLTVLSLVYGWLFAWRRNIWAVVAAHTLFDLVQMVGVIPFVLSQQIGASGPG